MTNLQNECCFILDIQKIGVSEGDTICVIMQNPSYADEHIADKSVNFLERLIFEESQSSFTGIRRLIIVNLFAFILTDGFQGEQNQIGIENDKFIENAITQSNFVLVAWGKNSKHKNRISQVTKILRKYPDKTLYESEKHPSRGTFSKSYIRGYDLPLENGSMQLGK
jgi:hypothetical protein